LTTRDYVDKPGVPVIRGSNLGDGGFVDTGFVFVSEKKAQDLRQNQARPGDVTFTQRGTIGQVAAIPASARYERYVLSQSQMRLTPDPSRVDARFIVYYFRSPSVLTFLSQNTLATGVPHINLSILRRVPVPLPPLPEQRRIADILDKADAIRRKRKGAIALTEELLRSAFLEMFGDPVTNPKRWEVRPLGDTFSEDPRIGTLVPAEDSGKQLVVRVGELGDYDITLPKCRRVSLAGNDLARFCLATGDVVLARAIGSEDHLGKASVLQDTTEAVVFDSHVMRLRFQPRRLLPYFFVQWLRSDGGRHLFMKQAGRTAVQFNVNARQIARVAMPLPPVDLQEAFVGLLQRVRGSRKAHDHYLREADVLFKSLVHRAFRGELTAPNGLGKRGHERLTSGAQ